MRMFLPIKGPGGRYLTPNEKVALLILGLTLVLGVLTLLAGEAAYLDDGAQNPIFGFVAVLCRGIGGGIILNGQLYRGVRYTAGELGHVVLMAGGPLCGCGKHGCAEALASRTAMERDIRARIKSGQKSLVPRLLEKKGQSTMSSSIIAAALERDDEVMHEVLAQAEYYMGLLVANVVRELAAGKSFLFSDRGDVVLQGFEDPVRLYEVRWREPT